MVPRSRILIIDDEPLLAESLIAVLSQYEVVSALTGEEALRLLEEAQEFDAILCDLAMPGISGIEIFERVSRWGRNLESRFVFMTGDAAAGRTARFLEKVKNPRLEKPFEREQLLAALVLVTSP